MQAKYDILIVDDNAAGRSLLNAILANEEYNLVYASSGQEALEKSLAIKPDLMLLDVMLPDMNGFEVCQAVRSNPYTSLMPVIMVTALNDRQSKLKALQTGADEFLSKPLDAFEVRARVGTVLKLDRFRRLLYDQDTGLPNETLFIDYIDHVMLSGDNEAAPAKSFAVLVVKLSNSVFLKNYLLKTKKHHQMFDRLTEVLQGGNKDVKIISYHRDGHFSILLDGAGREKAMQFAEYIVKAFQSPIKHEDGEILLTCKIGVSLYPDNGANGNELVNNAQLVYGEKYIENYSIKFYDDDVKELYRNNVEIAAKLYNAVEQDELVLHFQPQIQIDTQEIIAMEVLIRWNSGQYGFKYPDFFISHAEENGTIINIGYWVVREALRYLAGLSQINRLQPEMAINVSALQFCDPNFENMFYQFAREYNIEPERVKIEITESAIMLDPVDSQKKLQVLKEKGFKISIDDFGTGYASLVYLKNFPVDEIKIDKVFVQSIDTQIVNYNIIKYMIELAHTLNLRVVAEGVEEEKQLRLLGQLGCDVVQGYFFSKPVSEKAMTDMLVRQPFLKG